MVTPPEPLPPNLAPTEWEGILEPGEVVLWSVKKPLSATMVSVLWVVAIFFFCAFYAAWEAPKVWGMDAYCALNQSSSCGLEYLVSWPGALLCAYYGLKMSWLLLSRSEKPALCYAISPVRALRMLCGNPGSLQQTKLNGAKVGRNFLGEFRIKVTKYEKVTFQGLSENEMAEAFEVAIRGGAEKWP